MVELRAIAPEWLSLEQSKRKNNFEILKNTEGWEKLDLKQQKIIQLSLYLQDKAVRTTDKNSQKAISYYPEDYGDRPFVYSDKKLNEWWRDSPTSKKRKYRYEQNSIAISYCHAAICGLEIRHLVTETTLKDIKEIIGLEEYFEAQYKLIKTRDEIKEIIKNFGFPCVVHILFHSDKPDDRMLDVAHSFLALGQKNGDIIAYHKYSVNLPYEITTLSEIYLKYGIVERYWGVRNLKDKTSTYKDFLDSKISDNIK